MASSISKIAVLNYTGILPDQVKETTPSLAENLKLGVCLGRVENKSSNLFLTRVLHPDTSKKEPVFYATSIHSNMNTAIRSLRVHAGYSETESDAIGYINFAAERSRYKNPEIMEKIKVWARRNHFDGVVWVDVRPNIQGLTERPYSNTRSAITPLLEGNPTLLSNTQNYIKNNLQQTSLSRLEKSILQMEPQSLYLNPSSPQFQKTIDDAADERMKLPQTDKPESLWYNTSSQWGPLAKIHSAPPVPDNIAPEDHKAWKQRLVVTLALKYQGLQYHGPKVNDKFKTSERTDIPAKATNGQNMRGHFPGRGYGLDCSNFVSWIYNLSGIHFTSDCGKLVDQPTSSVSKGIGRTVRLDEPMEPGDLIFLDRRDPNNAESPPHVLIYCGTGKQIGKTGDNRRYYIDSTSSVRAGVAPRVLDGSWCEPSSSNQRFVRITRPLS